MATSNRNSVVLPEQVAES